MKRYDLVSSWIDFVEYNSSNGNMSMHLLNGSTYSYNFIPSDVFIGFITASSHGSYWNRNIRGKYE